MGHCDARLTKPPTLFRMLGFLDGLCTEISTHMLREPLSPAVAAAPQQQQRQQQQQQQRRSRRRRGSLDGVHPTHELPEL